MKPIDYALLSRPHITDVELFFADITQAYLDFAQNVEYLLSTVLHSPPDEILLECTKLRQQKNTLANLDDQMFEIIDLAGDSLVNSTMIHEYRIAFTKASMACNNLHQKLQLIRTTLHNKSVAPSSKTYSYSNI